MIQSFQCFVDPDGNLWVADGLVAQLRTGVRIPVGSGDLFSPAFKIIDGRRFVQVDHTQGATCVGGSGRNIVTTGLTRSLSGPAVPCGLFRPTRPDKFVLGIFTLTVNDSSSAAIHDGSDYVAILTGSSTAPIGSYAATPYGKTTYNEGSDFTIDAAAEEGAPGGLPDYSVTVSDGTWQAGLYYANDAATYISDASANFNIEVQDDGSADLLYYEAITAVRASGSPYSPEGVYESNEDTMFGEDPWRAFVQAIPRAPRSGFVYLRIHETANVLDAVTGPFLASTLPADGSGYFHVPIAQSDGDGGLAQLHTGLLLWSGAAGDKGDKGDKGDTGATGGTGATGATGAAGSDATVNATNVASVIYGATSKTTPADADDIGIIDSADSNALKKLTFANLWTWISGKIDAITTIANAKSFSGQVELSSQAATTAASAMSRDLARQELFLMAHRTGMVAVFNSNNASGCGGGTYMAFGSYSDLSAAAAKHASNYFGEGFSAFADYNGAAMDMSRSRDFILPQWIFNAPDGTIKFRVVFGVTSRTVPSSDAAPLSGRGMGFEYWYNSGTTAWDGRLFYYDTGINYGATTQLHAGALSHGYSRIKGLRLRWNQPSSQLELYFAAPQAIGVPRLPSTPTLTLPVTLTSNTMAGRYTSTELASHSTTTPAGVTNWRSRVQFEDYPDQ